MAFRQAIYWSLQHYMHLYSLFENLHVICIFLILQKQSHVSILNLFFAIHGISSNHLLLDAILYAVPLWSENSLREEYFFASSNTSCFVHLSCTLFFNCEDRGTVPDSRGSGDRFLILIFLVNIQYSGKGSNSSREQVVNPVSLLWMIHMPFP